MKTIGVVGLGVMGGSFAARLKELGFEVIGFDLSQDAIEYAVDHSMIDRGTTDPKQELLACDIIIICLYPAIIAKWVQENQQYIHPDALILEIAGVKEGITSQIRDILRKDVRLISVHPMCGRESKGIAYSSPDIFSKANFIIVPDPSNSEEDLKGVEFLARILGCRRVNRLSAREHDEMIAFLSQLTHIIAVSLMNAHENEHLVEYTGDSFRDLTRIARINEDMWSELFLENKELLLQEIDAFEASLASFRQALDEENAPAMKEMMKISTQRRKKFD